MSKHLVPTNYKGRAVELQWMNGIHNMHDMICGCQNTVKHLHHLLKRENHQLCLPSTEEDGRDGQHGDAGDEPFGEGDLDRLFEEDFDEDDG